MAVDPIRRLIDIDARELGISALFAAVVLFVAAMAMLSRNVAQLRDAFFISEQSQLLLRQMDQVHMKLTGTEMIVRGYALSGDPVFLNYYRETHGKLIVSVASLGEQVRNEPTQKADFDELEKRVEAHQVLFASLLKAPREVVADAITNPEKRRARDAVLALLDRMDAREDTLLEARRYDAENKAKRTFGLAIGIAIFAFIAGTVGFGLTFTGRRAGLSSRRMW